MSPRRPLRRLALALALAPAARAPLRANELDALKRLYDATGGAAWRKKGGWSMDAATSCNGTVPPLLPDQNPNDDGGARAACIRHDPCARETKWYGVACIDPCYLPADGADCSHGRVTLLELRDNSLRGTLPAELFGTLINVSMVDLARNELSGSIPTQLGKLRNLQSLQLNGNMLSGTIPTELGTAGHALGVGWREDRSGLEGLTRLELAQNSLSGIVPSQIGMLESLQLVDLAGNEELGYLPTSDPNLQLNPGLPPEIGSLSHLQVLKLNGCGFRGTLPTQIGKMARLSQLYARGTTADEAASKHTGGAAAAAAEGVRIESNRFSGTLPTELGRLTRLQLLGLEANRLSGSIPSEIGELAELRRWETGENRLVGSMPDVFDRYLYLEYWDTYANQMSGDLAPSIQHAKTLQYLYVQNEHTGPLRNFRCRERIPGPWQHGDALLPDDEGKVRSVPKHNGKFVKFNWVLMARDYYEMRHNNVCPDPFDVEFTFNAITGDI